MPNSNDSLRDQVDNLFDSARGVTSDVLDRLAAAEAGAGTGASYAGETCVVTAIRHGKANEIRVEVSADLTVKQLIETIGWTATNHTFKKKSNDGALAEVVNPAATKLGPGEHLIFASPKVAGGVR